MIWFVDANENGVVSRWSSSPSNPAWVAVDTELDPANIWLKNGAAMELPPRPSVSATFDTVLEAWVGNPGAELQSWREATSCTRMQGILALGPVRWGTVMAYRDTASWPEQIVIDSASDWNRLSQNIEFFAYLLSLSEEEVDDLFATAVQILA